MHAPVRIVWMRGALSRPLLSAGILYLLAFPLTAQMLCPSAAWPVVLDISMLGIVPLLLLAGIVGALLALLPVLIGTAAMAELGRHNLGLQHPAMWALAGAATAAGICATLGTRPDEPPALALIFTGSACALLARQKIRWIEAER
ncbi:hypothetical protein AB2M62_08305 [Sphingomonas sp. MMS12-HWE2-04]|uniref:hypothetical protein n=1 Tax=Sphingomonas sp. MMS12-HWE2-04 TaxID=3234199 RepID=UPI00384CE373